MNLSFKFEVTLFITLAVIADGQKLQYLIIHCWKSIIASFIDKFPLENETIGRHRVRRDSRDSGEAAGAVNVLCFHCTNEQLKGATSL